MAAPYRVIISPAAGKDLEDIFDHIGTASPRNAPAFVKRLLDGIDRLEDFPHRNVVGGHRRGLRQPVRSLPVKPYIVFFRVIEADHVVRVLRVRHGARRRPRRFD